MGRKDSFDNVLKQEIDNWVNRNRPLISEDKDFSNGTRYFMLTDHEHIFDIGKDLSDENSYKKGQFVIIPNTFGKNDQARRRDAAYPADGGRHLLLQCKKLF